VELGVRVRDIEYPVAQGHVNLSSRPATTEKSLKKEEQIWGGVLGFLFGVVIAVESKGGVMGGGVIDSYRGERKQRKGETRTLKGLVGGGQV